MAYHFQANLRDHALDSGASSSYRKDWELIPSSVWKRIWHCRSWPKIKNFLWRCCTEGVATEEVIFKAHKAWQEFEKTSTMAPYDSQEGVDAFQLPQSWQCPPTNFIKINGDAATQEESTMGGIGFVLRNYLGDPLAAVSEVVDFPSVLFDEAIAIRSGLIWAQDAGYPRLQVESDNSTLINYLNNPSSPIRWELDGIIHDIRSRSITHETRPFMSPQFAPEPSGALPIIGHLSLLRGLVPLSRSLGAIADKYGPIFMIRLGVHRALVVSSLEVIKECFTTHDKVFATRQPCAAGKYLGYNYAFLTFAPHGPYWREIKKTVTLELLSKNRLDMLKHIRKGEIDTCIQELYSYWAKNRGGGGGAGPVSVEMDRWFCRLNFNVITKMIAGKRYFNTFDDTAKDENEEAGRFEKLIEELTRLSGIFVPSDVLPYLEWMDLQGHLKAMKSIAKEVDSLIGNWLEDHHHHHHLHEKNKQKQEEDFMDLMLSIFPDEEKLIYGYDRDTVIKATVLTLIVGATDTTFIALTWALSLLLKHPNVLKRARDELDAYVGKDRNVDESDIKNLVYLQAIAKETLRLYPPGPVLPRQAMEDCQLGGYHVPSGTHLLVNIWKLHRDPSVWSDPDEFKPERFLTTHADVDFKAQEYRYIPFSAGRRQCPGITLATQVFHLTLARLLHGFDVMNALDAPVDMTEGVSLTLPKANPLHVLITPRLPSKLYED
ncbi:xanthotoxin 5-hydroxylase CYP82C4-like [Telopea speciosissima]|uniref:xanthotoxin 5-hydroxylase CYP82C4-like n=1 Tax=Telopea speciosissima TaxID=54955 RepID=UPI001CC6D83E|nr:xanthotoxin 5-hydroxylase CYP82C4-like [Telopea speciosissima]